MDMNEEVIKALDRRSKKGVRNIVISPLFEKGKFYNIKTDEELPESVGGCLAPEYNHCWLTWQSKWIDFDGSEQWGNEAYNFPTLEEAEVAKKYLEKSLV